MQIEFHDTRQVTINEFADQYGLVMEIHHRGDDWEPDMRYYAHFKHSDTCDGPTDRILTGTVGNGSAPGEAIRNYARKISGKLLVLNNMGEDRREIWVPQLTIKTLEISWR